MDDSIVTGLLIGVIVVGVVLGVWWLQTLNRRRVLAAVRKIATVHRLTPFMGAHRDFDAVWMAVRGSVHGVAVSVLGRMSRGSRNPGLVAGAGLAAAGVELPSLLVSAGFAEPAPWSFTIRRRGSLERGEFATTDPAFDKVVIVETENPEPMLMVLTDSAIRGSLAAFLKRTTANGRVTQSHVSLRLSGFSSAESAVTETVNLVRLLGPALKAAATPPSAS